jgi:hypothetical protein
MAYSINAKDYFKTKLYTGNGSTNAQTGIGFLPSWTWIKTRSHAGYVNALVDAVRGVTKELRSNATTAEGTTTNSFTSFDSDGFTLGADSGDNYNKSGNTYVSWNWKANGQGSSNTDGTINSTYTSASTASGVSIVTYTGTNTLGATVGHGLGIAPKMIIVKSRTGGGENWNMYHESLGATKYMNLNTANSAYTDVNAWNNTAPTASVFSIGGNSGDTGRSGSDYVAYCFAEKQGFSKFGTYLGNGSNDGSFCYLGFKPSLVLVKRTDAGNSSYMYSQDTSTTGGNLTDKFLKADEVAAESTTTGEYAFDFLSNGFKARGTGGGMNANGGDYIFMAFASASLVGSNNVPANAH